VRAVTRPPLVLAIGNPSRGDDALGPAFAAALPPDTGWDVLVDFQLQVEHALDLVGRPRVLLVDASATAPPPWSVAGVIADGAGAPFSHALGPAQLLAACSAVGAAPPTFVLGIRGERFVLGDPLSRTARGHLAAALDWFAGWSSGGDPEIGRRLGFEGVVQGVGFRPFLHGRAVNAGLRGRVWNGPDGVTALVSGPASAVWGLVAATTTDGPPGARVDAVTVAPAAVDDAGFSIVPAPDGAAPARLALLADAATCAACLADAAGPGPFAGWPLVSCAACGPRWSITTALPWARDHTTLTDWPRCADCERRYLDPRDRRFHAEGSTCERCGPPVWLVWPAWSGPPVAGAAAQVSLAAALLRGGGVLGVHGLGAHHLAVDATDPAAVRRLRALKRRESRPFAVMVPDEAAATVLVELDEAALDALRSPARPIVVGLARSGHDLAPEVAPDTRRLGVMLPYSALHQQLVLATGRPLVLTSANAEGAPPFLAPAAVLEALGGEVDGFLFHHRTVAHRVEDSVVSAVPGAPRVLRRARGLAPSSFRLPVSVPAPVLAVGGHHQSAVCVVVGDSAFLGPHLGDLDTVEAEHAWIAEVEAFERLLGVRCEVLAHDLHPDYASTRYALERRARERVGVQHHAAHAFAALAESGIDEPVIAVVLDGSGWGPDGTSWGAEVLVVEGSAWQRLASFRPLSLPGGERAIRHVWRQGFAALYEAFGDDAESLADRFAVFAAIPRTDRSTVARLLATGVNTPRARGVGRWFDAFGCLTLGRSVAHHEAQVAVAFEEAAGTDARAYPVGMPTALARGGQVSSEHEVDLRPTVRALVDALGAGVPVPEVAARVHATLVGALGDVVEQALLETGARRVLGTGGAMANLRLSRGLAQRLGRAWWAPRVVPPGDGGLALGQAWAAAHLLDEPRVQRIRR
jgi:hydrogenase maturation protein HypF